MEEQKNIFLLNKPTRTMKSVKPSDLNKVNAICKKVCLFTNVRNEKHIKEWAAHHLLLGFSKIVIFDHKSEKPLKEEFDNFDKRVKIINVSHLENPIKMMLMNKAAEIANLMKVDWMIYLDADEFIILNDNNYSGIKHLLSVYNHADSLALNWLMFGSNNLRKDPNGLILENYTKSDLLLHDHVKSFVRPSKILNATNPHYYNMKDAYRYFDVNNRLMIKPYHSNICHLEYYKVPVYIAHHIYQSEEAFLKRKIRLPRDDSGERRHFNDIKFIHGLHNSQENEYPKNQYVEKVKTFLSQYGHDY
jgi:hypothetical protein